MSSLGKQWMMMKDCFLFLNAEKSYKHGLPFDFIYKSTVVRAPILIFLPNGFFQRPLQPNQYTYS